VVYEENHGPVTKQEGRVNRGVRFEVSIIRPKRKLMSIWEGSKSEQHFNNAI
jgi:hypothetical protein